MRKILLLAAPVVAMAGFVWAAQEKGGKEQKHEMEKPTKEHLSLKEGAGTWDYVMKMREAPDKPEMESKGVETCVALGDFWIVFDIKTDNMMGMAWAGHGTPGYDPAKKKFIGTFIESMSSDRMLGEGTMDADGKVLTVNWEGGHMKMREVFEKRTRTTA